MKKRVKIAVRDTGRQGEMARRPVVSLDSDLTFKEAEEVIETFGKSYRELVARCIKIKEDVGKSRSSSLRKDRVLAYWKIGDTIRAFKVLCEKRSYSVYYFTKELSKDLHIPIRTLNYYLLLREEYPHLPEKGVDMPWSYYVELLRLPKPYRKLLEVKVSKEEIKSRDELRTEVERLLEKIS